MFVALLMAMSLPLLLSCGSDDDGDDNPSNNGGKSSSEYVDLGLSVKWATCNVGATKPEEYGKYYAWAETATKQNYTWGTYKYCGYSDDFTALVTKYCTNAEYGMGGFTDGLTTLSSDDDAATTVLGHGWRTPTASEMQELVNKCTWTWAAVNGVNGYRITGPNGNSIFLPAAGFYDATTNESTGKYGRYWTSNVGDGEGDDSYAQCMRFYSPNDGGEHYMSYRERQYGHTIRAVHQ